MEVGGPPRSHTANFSVDISVTSYTLLVYGVSTRWRRRSAGLQEVCSGRGTVTCAHRYFRYSGLVDCACDWHRPSWPVGGIVKRADPPRPSAKHIGRPPPPYPAGLLPWTTPSPFRYINALWVVGTLPFSTPLSLPLCVCVCVWQTWRSRASLILMMRLQLYTSACIDHLCRAVSAVLWSDVSLLSLRLCTINKCTPVIIS